MKKRQHTKELAIASRMYVTPQNNHLQGTRAGVTPSSKKGNSRLHFFHLSFRLFFHTFPSQRSAPIITQCTHIIHREVIGQAPSYFDNPITLHFQCYSKYESIPGNCELSKFLVIIFEFFHKFQFFEHSMCRLQ